jgi:hypothetical protein
MQTVTSEPCIYLAEIAFLMRHILNIFGRKHHVMV